VGIAFSLLNLGLVLRSPAFLQEGIGLEQELGDLRRIAVGKALLGHEQALEGKSQEAIGLFASAMRGHVHLGDRWFVIFDLMGIAEALLADKQTAEAVRFFAAAQALAQTLDIPVGGVTYQRLIATMARLRDDARFAASWAAGAQMSREQAITAALALATPVPPEPQRVPASRPESEPLTQREREIAQLLARGDSNRQIADALSIGIGTVNVHVHRILGKLGLYSRQQVADWLETAAPPTRERD
jgi:non-specific serine/threonine protein kinase